MKEREDDEFENETHREIDRIFESLRDTAEVVLGIAVFNFDEDGAQVMTALKGESKSIASAMAMLASGVIGNLEEEKRMPFFVKFMELLKDELEEIGFDILNLGDDDEDDFNGIQSFELGPDEVEVEEDEEDEEEISIEDAIKQLEKDMNNGDT